MEEVDIWECELKENPKPFDPIELDAHWKMEIKVKRIIVNYVKEHFVSHIVDKTLGKITFYALVKLF